MSLPVTISLSPNTTSRDVRTAWHTLIHPETWRDESLLVEVAGTMAQEMAGRFVVLTSSGRQALHDILRAYGIGRGDEVIVQAFTCIAVPEPILWTGATPVYADIDPKTYNLTAQTVAEKIDSHTKAIIVQHTFGLPAPIDEIIELARQHNIIVIEDCAHAFGASLRGRPLGTIGDAAFVSFGRDKMVSSVFGGAAIFSNRTHVAAAQRFNQNRSYPPAAWVIQQLLHPILFSAILPTYFYGLGKGLLVLAQQLGLLSKAVAHEERLGKRPNHFAWRYSPALASLLVQQLEDFSTHLEARQRIGSHYLDSFAGTTQVQVPAIAPESEPAWLRFPVQVTNRDELLIKARQHNMLLGDWYDAPLVPADSSFEAFRYTGGSCPVAEQVSRHVLNLPTYARLTNDQVAAVIELVQRYASTGN